MIYVVLLQDYSDDVKKIPVACISVEDAEMFSRMAKRGKNYQKSLQLFSKS